MSIANGGFAFPGSVRKEEKYMDEGGFGRVRTVTLQTGGLTKLEWFAGMAMAALVSDPTLAETIPYDEKIAEKAFEIAEAMLAEGGRE